MMIIQPKMRGFICTTAHPAGCAANVRNQAIYAKEHPAKSGPKRVLVIGSSTGYGLASRIAAAFGGCADTIGVFFERPASGSRTATAGWYNNQEFERLAKADGLVAESVNGDAFSKEIKADTINLIKEKIPGGKVDLVIYSVAAPKRTDPETGEVYSSVIKPIGKAFADKTVDFHTGVVSQVEVASAPPEEITQTVAVMGGADWLLWIKALLETDTLENNAATIAFSYIGPVLTHAVYKDGTIGRAKEDLEEKAGEISALLAPAGGKAFVSVNKALVTQASAAIPVVPLYISILFRIMKQAGTHEDCIQQMVRMFGDRLCHGGKWDHVPVDEAGRIRMDDWEMEPAVQQKVTEIWQRISTENIDGLADLAGYREDFYRLFGFGLPGVDYDADVEA